MQACHQIMWLILVLENSAAYGTLTIQRRKWNPNLTLMDKIVKTHNMWVVEVNTVGHCWELNLGSLALAASSQTT